MTSYDVIPGLLFLLLRLFHQLLGPLVDLLCTLNLQLVANLSPAVELRICIKQQWAGGHRGQRSEILPQKPKIHHVIKTCII